MDDRIKIIILAAGKGTRMKNELPKVLAPIRGKSMIKYLLEAVEKSGVDNKPVIVVGYEKEKVMKELGGGYDYVVEEEQLGTGHAVMVAQKILEKNADNVVVLYGDHPFIKPETIKKLVETHIGSDKKITMGVVKVQDFKDWRAFFYTDSRIIRNKNGDIVKDVQFRDANDEERKIKEINPCYFCFEASWLWKKLKTLNTDNDQKQYYLTDLVKIAIEEKTAIGSIEIEPYEALGADSKEEIEMLERLVVQ